jgi:hypothetical protein
MKKDKVREIERIEVYSRELAIFCWILKWIEDNCMITMELGRIVEIKRIERNRIAFGK